MLQAIHLILEVDPLNGPLFQDANLCISKGDKVALFGANGSGKSTLLLALAGEIAPSSGHVVRAGGCQVGLLRQDLPPDLIGSPGERMKAALGRLLAAKPDILLLDEPTNHLDLPAREWLEGFVRECRQGVLVVTHDRNFADAVADRTLEIDAGRIYEYGGGYSEVLSQRAARVQGELDRYEREKAEVRRLKTAAEQIHQRAGRACRSVRDPYHGRMQRLIEKRAKAVRTRVEKLTSRTIEKPFVSTELKLVFPTEPLRSQFAVQGRGLSKAFGGNYLFNGLALDAEKGERVALVGPNGAGKSTLINCLLNPALLDAGHVSWGSGTNPALLSQERLVVDPDETVLEALDQFDEERVRTLLGCLGMTGGAAEKPCGVLSVGERSRVELVRILLSGANVLFLDEPTNHLDLPSLEAVERALRSFTGSVIFASHDRRFIEEYADRVIELGGR